MKPLTAVAVIIGIVVLILDVALPKAPEAIIASRASNRAGCD
jgi:hypothetical protein